MKQKINNLIVEKSLEIKSAVQTTDLNWDDFFNGEADIYCWNSSAHTEKSFLPVTPEYALAYDGQNHSISNIKVEASGSSDAGLFGELKREIDTDVSSVKNLKLVDLQIKNTAADKSTGALAGSATNITVTNVIAVNSRNKDNNSPSGETIARKADGTPKATITGKGSTGGLIGTATDCTVSKCAAALVVESTGGNAGGLIGTVDKLSDEEHGTTVISASYSGGHTKEADYKQVTDNDPTNPKIVYNVTGVGDVGGLVGSFDGKSILYSYSTCSASTSGANVGGLVGSATLNDSLNKCYATGLVNGADSTHIGAFVGSLICDTAKCTNCTYYEIVNEIPKKDGNPDGSDGYEYRPALGTDISITIRALDTDRESYKTFAGTSSDGKAIPYDTTLNHYYKGKYPYLTAAWLATGDSNVTVGADDFVTSHYGDWPAPEVWTRNEQT